MKTICYECGKPLKIEYERNEWDGELYIELAHCSHCDPQGSKLESIKEAEYERGFEDGKEEMLEEENDQLNEEWEQKVEKFEAWVRSKFISENYDLYREINQKLIDLELV